MKRLSHRNARVGELRSLARQRRARADAGLFVIEGPKLVAEAISANVPLTSAFVDSVAIEDRSAVGLLQLIDQIEDAGTDVFAVDSDVIKRVSSTSSPQPVLAIASGAAEPIDELGADVDFVLLAVDVNDPGNLGTLVRSAVASGADAVVVAGQSVDVFNPKTVRSTAGALFQVPIFVSPDAATAVAALQGRGIECVGTSGRATIACDAADLTKRLAVVMGSEAHGLSAEVEGLMDELVSIPMPGPVESLNVAMAAAILCYETQRQRRSKIVPSGPASSP